MIAHPRQHQMELAATSAGDEWLAKFERFVRGWRQGEFTGEEITKHAIPVVGHPTTCRAWGSAISRLARQGVIVRVPGKVATRWNGNMAPVWRLNG